MKNPTAMQYFEWYLPADGRLWRQAEAEAARLAADGITALWLPPAYKGAAGREDVGYGVYDLYDLGEFAQRGTVATKYGTKAEYLAAIQALQREGIAVWADAVLDHRMGADGTEQVSATPYDWVDRYRQTGPARTISAWTSFTFPGRGGRYSDFCWNWEHFDGIDWDDATGEKAIFKFQGKEWDSEVDSENGNYDYLMGADVDLGNPQVVEELTRWGLWYLSETGVDGFRIDAAKHIRFTFFRDWLHALRRLTGKPVFAVGEYWNQSADALCHYIGVTGGSLSLFDVPLHQQFCQASRSGGNFDMGSLGQNALVQRAPQLVVTFVDNHDTQPGQALESWVEGWFKPLAYAYILLRSEGLPCVFYGDYYGIPHDGIAPVGQPLSALLWARQTCAWGPQIDAFDDRDVVGWSRQGDPSHPGSGLCAVLTDGPGGQKRLFAGPHLTGKTLVDCLGGRGEEIAVGADGWVTLPVGGGSCSVCVQKETWLARTQTPGATL